MNINISIIDQHVSKIARDFGDFLPKDKEKAKSAAWVLLCIKHILDVGFEDALDFLVDGSSDLGINGLHVGDELDGEFIVTIFQGKYKRNFDGKSNFPENSIVKLINTISYIFDPNKFFTSHDILTPKIEEIRSMVQDGNLPVVKIYCCNNGLIWDDQAQEKIEQESYKQVEWFHFNHDNIVEILQKTKPVDDVLHLKGKAVIEGFNYKRVLIGKVPISEIKTLFDKHGNLLLQRNVRRFLGLYKNRVNLDIKSTILNKGENFYFFNNGITIICSKFSHNELQGNDYQVRIENLEVINGGQTCKTIQQTLKWNPAIDVAKTFVMLRLYELDDKDANLVRDITCATNSQNPIDLRDLRSNDEIQKKLELDVKAMGERYVRHRGAASFGISPNVAAEAILAVWRRAPHQAKFRRSIFFGKLYDKIFTSETNAAQLLLAVLIFRYVDAKRKTPEIENPPRFLPYASQFLSMIIGDLILKEKNINVNEITHNNFDDFKKLFSENKVLLYKKAIEKLKEALQELKIDFDGENLNLQRLAATFRRGDLLTILK